MQPSLILREYIDTFSEIPLISNDQLRNSELNTWVSNPTTQNSINYTNIQEPIYIFVIYILIGYQFGEYNSVYYSVLSVDFQSSSLN